MTKIDKISEVNEADTLLLHMIESKFSESVVYIPQNLGQQNLGSIVVTSLSNPYQGGVIDQKTLNVTYHLYRLDVLEEPEYFL